MIVAHDMITCLKLQWTACSTAACINCICHKLTFEHLLLLPLLLLLLSHSLQFPVPTPHTPIKLLSNTSR